MESPAAEATSRSTADRRRSGRVVRRPDHLDGYAPNNRNKADGDIDSDEDEDDEDEDEDDEEDDEEEIKAKRKRSKKGAPAKPRPAKRARENGDGITVAIRPAKKSKPRRAVRFSALDNATGLYGKCCRCRRFDPMFTWLTLFFRS